jgi:hypothetical protein
LLYLAPRTAILGAVLLTGYLGGAVAAQVRVVAGWFNILFSRVARRHSLGRPPLRDHCLRELLPLHDR